MRIDLGSGAARIRRKDTPRIPRWLHAILEVPLELKLLAANLIILGAALLLLFGPVQLRPSRPVDAYIFVAVLTLGATVNLCLVRLALAPLRSIERVAKSVSQGRFGDRVPASIVADRDLVPLSRTINEMLDSLAADRKRIEKLTAEAPCTDDERSQPSRLWRGTPVGGIAHGISNTLEAN